MVERREGITLFSLWMSANVKNISEGFDEFFFEAARGLGEGGKSGLAMVMGGASSFAGSEKEKKKIEMKTNTAVPPGKRAGLAMFMYVERSFSCSIIIFKCTGEAFPINPKACKVDVCLECQKG